MLTCEAENDRSIYVAEFPWRNLFKLHFCNDTTAISGMIDISSMQKSLLCDVALDQVFNYFSLIALLTRVKEQVRQQVSCELYLALSVVKHICLETKGNETCLIMCTIKKKIELKLDLLVVLQWISEQEMFMLAVLE